MIMLCSIDFEGEGIAYHTLQSCKADHKGQNEDQY